MRTQTIAILAGALCLAAAPASQGQVWIHGSFRGGKAQVSRQWIWRCGGWWNPSSGVVVFGPSWYGEPGGPSSYAPPPAVDGGMPSIDPTLLPGADPDRAKPQEQTPREEDLPLPERAALRFRAGKPKQAEPLLAQHLQSNTDDAAALRLLALVLADDRRAVDAAAVLRAAYLKAPALAESPIDRAGLGLTDNRLAEMVNRAVQEAQRGKNASGWLLVTVLMQAQGRGELALKQLKKAQELGLEPTVADPLARVLAALAAAKRPAVPGAGKP